jgi:hypothetical protein
VRVRREEVRRVPTWSLLRSMEPLYISRSKSCAFLSDLGIGAAFRRQSRVDVREGERVTFDFSEVLGSSSWSSPCILEQRPSWYRQRHLWIHVLPFISNYPVLYPERRCTL